MGQPPTDWGLPMPTAAELAKQYQGLVPYSPKAVLGGEDLKWLAEPQRQSRIIENPSRPPWWNIVGLYLTAFGLYGTAIAINVWNAWASDLALTAIPLTLGVFAESGLFFLTPCVKVLRGWLLALAIALLAFFLGFAVLNGLRMASILSADQSLARATRETSGTANAEVSLISLRQARDSACAGNNTTETVTRGKRTQTKVVAETEACKDRKGEVARAEASATQAKGEVKALARPESQDFARLISWLSLGRIEPSADAYDLLWLLFRTLLPQAGGLVLMLARR